MMPRTLPPIALREGGAVGSLSFPIILMGIVIRFPTRMLLASGLLQYSVYVLNGAISFENAG
jgi:hypothetical protein